MDNIKSLVEKIDALEKGATKGPWEHEGRTCGFLEDMNNIILTCALRNAWPELKAALAPLAEPSPWQIALMSLTAGGSEFTSPDACVAYVRQVRDSQHEAIVKFKKEYDALSAELAMANSAVGSSHKETMRVCKLYDELEDKLEAATARAGASEKDAKLLNGFEKSHQSVYYTTNDWRGVEESGWAYWEEFGPEGPHLYPDIRAAMQAALDAAGRSGG